MNGQKVFVQTIDKHGRTIKSKSAPKRIKEDRFCTRCGKKLNHYNRDNRCYSCESKRNSMRKTDEVFKWLKENDRKFRKPGDMR